MRSQHRTSRLALVLGLAAVPLAAPHAASAAPSSAPSAFAAPSPTTPAFDAGQFATPRSDSRPAVLWFWNGEVTPELVDQQMADFRAKGVYELEIFGFDTTALKPTYFSEAWFDLIEHTLREAQRTGMHLWLANDDIFPSGRAGGFLVKGGTVGDRTYPARPELRMKGVRDRGSSIVDGGRSYPTRTLLSAGLAVADGRLVVDATRRKGVTLLKDGADWTDYSVASTVRLESGAAGTMVRSTDEKNGILVDLRPDGGVEIYRQVDGAFTLLQGGAARPGFDAKADHRLSVRLRGDEIAASVDGAAEPAVRDATFAEGRVGVRADGTQRAQRDDLEVTAPDGSTLLSETFDDPSSLGAFDLPAPKVDALAALAARPLDGPDAGDPQAVVDLTQRAKDDEPWVAPPGRWEVRTFEVETLIDDSNFRRNYLDTLDPETMQRYMDVIPGEYYRRFAWAFGGVLRGFTDDEPFLSSAAPHFQTTPWSPGLPDELERHGTDPAKALMALTGELGAPGAREAGRFWRAVSDRFTSAYYAQQETWMADHGVQYLSNPLWDEYGPAEQLKTTGNLNSVQQHAQVPGTDVVFGQYAEGLASILPRWPASAAHQVGRPRVYNETVGAAGWQTSPTDARNQIGSFAVRGVNQVALHAAFSDLSRTEYPPPFDRSNPWWRVQGTLSEWIGRINEFARHETAAPTALLQPQRAVEAAQNDPDAVKALDTRFVSTVHSLEDRQVDFDLLDEGALSGDPALKALAVVGNGTLRVGEARYRAVVLPETPELSLAAARTLARFVRTGGLLVAAGPLPSTESEGRDGELRELFAELATPDGSGSGRLVQVEGADGAGTSVARAGLAAASLSPADPRVRVLRFAGADGEQAFLVVNERDAPTTVTARFPATGAPRSWDPTTGDVTDVATYEAGDTDTAVPLTLQPGEVVGYTFAADGAPVAPHATAASPGATVERIRRTDDGLRAVLTATVPGPIQVQGTDGRKDFRGATEVADTLEPIPLGGDWRLQSDATGGPAATRPLGSWNDLTPTFSGSATYGRSFDVSAGTLAGRRFVLDLGDVRTTAEVTVNGRALPPRLWAPYRVDVTDALKAGANTVAVTVTNTGANSHGDPRPSGLLGPVALRPTRRVEVDLQAQPAPSDPAPPTTGIPTGPATPGQDRPVPAPAPKNEPAPAPGRPARTTVSATGHASRSTLRRRGVLVRVRVTGPTTIRVRLSRNGAQIGRAERRVRRAGTYRIRVRTTAVGDRRLRSPRPGRTTTVTVRASARVGGTLQTATHALRVRR